MIQVKEKYYKMAEKCLKSYSLLKAHITNLEEELKIIDLEDGVGAINYSKEKIGQAYKINRSTEETAVNKTTRKDLLLKQIELYKSKLQKIDNGLCSLEEEEKLILIDKYIKGLQWWEITAKVHIGERHCKRKRSIAVCKLAFMFYGEMSLLCPEFFDAI